MVWPDHLGREEYSSGNIEELGYVE